jgi:hypothetical protein
MFTDKPPRTRTQLAKFMESDRLTILDLPNDSRFFKLSQSIDLAMKEDNRAKTRSACIDFLTVAAEFYGVSSPDVRALAARPLRVREGGWASELFGDYCIQTQLIRIWTRTAVRKQITSFGTFLSTLCHEFSHHLDCQRFEFGASPHTRGFYARTALLYHHSRGTPMKPLVWLRAPRDRWRIDWSRM